MDKGLGDKIVELRRKEKLSYNKICERLGCSKGTVAYHLGQGQKEKNKLRQLKNAEKKNIRRRKKKAYLLEFSWRYRRICGCAKCGIKDPRVLQYDHIDSSEKKLSVSWMVQGIFCLELIKTEIRKCQILCANCHSIKSSEQLNYYKPGKYDWK